MHPIQIIKTHEAKTNRIKEIDDYIIIVGDFNTPLSNGQKSQTEDKKRT